MLEFPNKKAPAHHCPSFRDDTQSWLCPEDPKLQGGGILESQQLLWGQGLQDGAGGSGGVQLNIFPLTPCICAQGHLFQPEL